LREASFGEVPDTQETRAHTVASLHMDGEGRLSPTVATSVGRVGDTRCAAAPSSTAYELHVLAVPEKARNIATSETSSDDELGASRTPRPNDQQREMSRVPLLVRSSPAQGTGKLSTPVRIATKRCSHSFHNSNASSDSLSAPKTIYTYS
jgi:hypothetical protein